LTDLPAHIAAVVELLPGCKAQIERLVMSSEQFRALCEDYGLATETLALLQAHRLPQDAARVAEYRQLTEELALVASVPLLNSR
jgi:crotonobetainyl-CoA:carnitine CoA-transferase CaiB-like acyl-CoA transferase